MTETSFQNSSSPEQQPSSMRSPPLVSQLRTESQPDKKTNQSAILTPSRTAYLPLVSPSIEEDGLSKEQNGLKRSREQEPASYFNIKKQETTTNDTSSSAILSDEDEEVSTPKAKRTRIPLVRLPDEIGNPLMRAIEQSMSVDPSSKNGESSSSVQNMTRQHRAMSVPRNLRSNVHPVTALMIANRRPSTNNQAAPAAAAATDVTSERQRRDSVRAQQLSLLASQARLALSGTSNVNTAIRTENAVKGAVMKVLNDVQARKHRESISGLTATNSGSTSPISTVQSERGESSSPAKESNKDVANDQIISPQRLRDPTATWSEALQNAKSAVSFLDSAKEVARDWANGFYAYEKEWIGTALQKEQSKLDNEKNQEQDSRNNVGRRTSMSAPPVSAQEEESTLTDKDMVIPVEPMKESDEATPNYTTTSSKLLNSIPQKVIDSAVIPTRTIEFGNGGGKLVDVLSNFATLIDSHKEGCHSLEKLAQNARRLSAVQLPTVRFDTSTTSTATTTIGSTSAVSSDAGSPMSVAGLMS